MLNRMWFSSFCIATMLSLAASMTPSCQENVKTDKCNCIRSGPKSLELTCPIEKPNVLIGIEEPSGATVWMVRIDCLSNLDYMDIIPAVFIPKVKGLVLQACPLPRFRFQNLLNKLNITNLEYLKYELYNLQNFTITKDYFTGWETVTDLLLRDNSMNVDGNLLQNFPNLQNLDLSRNNIILTADLFTPLQKLRELRIPNNNIQYIPDNVFQNLKELQILEMWSNNISELNKNSFTGLDDLVLLELSFNGISSIQENTFDNLINIEKISLAHNKIEFLPKDVFSKSRQLKLIRLDNNPLKNFSDYQFSDLPNLTEINLSNSLIEGIPESIFWSSKNLEIVNLSQNHLHGIPKHLFRDTSSVKVLDLHANNLQHISHESFGNLRKLEVLRLEYNHLTEISPLMFAKLRNIVEINLSNNNINKIHSESFDGNQKLQKLSLSYNTLGKGQNVSATYSRLKELSDLNLSHNAISELNFTELFITNKNLKTLDVSHNSIKKIQVSDFITTYRKNTLVVNLSNNNIQEVSFAQIMYDQLPNEIEDWMVKIILFDNPLNCDCLAVDLSKYFRGNLDPRLRKVVDISSYDLVCALPRDLKNTSVVEVPIDKFVCPCNISEDCNCLKRGIDNHFVLNCSNRGLTHYPDISLLKPNKIEIDLSNNSLTNLIERPDYENVTKLILSNNLINTLTWVPPHIEVLKLDNNRLKRLGTHILKVFNDSQTISDLILYDNPWNCDCSTEGFIDFLRFNFRKVDVSTVRCKEDNDTIVALSKIYLCQRNKEDLLIAVTVVLLTLLICMSLAGICYIYRCKIRLWFYTRNSRLGLIAQDINSAKENDAFIGYSNNVSLKNPTTIGQFFPAL